MCWYWDCYRQRSVRSNRTFDIFGVRKFFCSVLRAEWDRKRLYTLRPELRGAITAIWIA
jgi:hypothetical protein